MGVNVAFLSTIRDIQSEYPENVLSVLPFRSPQNWPLHRLPQPGNCRFRFMCDLNSAFHLFCATVSTVATLFRMLIRWWTFSEIYTPDTFSQSHLNKAPSLHRLLITVSAVSDFLGDVHDDPVVLSKCSPKDNVVLMSQKILKISQVVFFFIELAENATRNF